MQEINLEKNIIFGKTAVIFAVILKIQRHFLSLFLSNTGDERPDFSSHAVLKKHQRDI